MSASEGAGGGLMMPGRDNLTGVMMSGRDNLTFAGLHNSSPPVPPHQHQVPPHQHQHQLPQPQPQLQHVPHQAHLPYHPDSASSVYSPAPVSSQMYQTSGGGGGGGGGGTPSPVVEASSGSAGLGASSISAGLGVSSGSAGLGASSGSAGLGASSGCISVGVSLPKKRGRPRKYSQNTNIIPVTTTGVGMLSAPPCGGSLTPAGPVQAPPPSQAAPVTAPPPSQAAPLSEGGLGSPPPAKKGRGRPPGSGSGKKQHYQYKEQQEQSEGLGSAGYAFTPHMFHVNTGEDLASKIMSFTQQGPKDICVLSATGCISDVTIREAATSGGTATYQGVFDIVSLSGSFLLTEIGGHRTRTGGLSIALTGPDGRLFGGGVAGLLIAATPVQVVCASFISDGRKEPKPVTNMAPLSSPPRVVNPGGGGAAAPGTSSSSPSNGTPSGSSGGPTSPHNLVPGSYPINGQGMPNIPGMPWK